MEKIDRLGWAEGISLYAYGLRIGVRVNKPEVLAEVEKRLPPGWEPSCTPIVDHLYSLKVGGTRAGGRVRDYTLLYGGLTKLARTMDLQEALDIFEGDIQLHVGEWARNRVFVHAGVVGWRGKALLLPGSSLAGKSTLVAALLRAGATYYSDEFAVLDGRGYVHPFPRPLAIRQPDGQRPKRCTPEELGSEAGVLSLPVGLTAVLRHHPGGRWRPRALSAGQGVLEVLNHTLPAQREPDVCFHTLQTALAGVPVLRGLRGGAKEAAEELLRLMEQPTPKCIGQNRAIAYCA
jgi:hypothetical protein